MGTISVIDADSVIQTIQEPNVNGATNAANSSPVALATDQMTVLAAASLQVTGNTSLASILANTPTLGQKTSSGSVPIVIASDQSTLPVSISSIALPTGASTSALQITGNTTLSSILTNTPSLGQAAMTASVPVVLASNQSSIPVSTPLAGPIAGQKVIAVTNTAVALPNVVLVNGITITAHSTNTGNLFVGASGVLTTDDGTGNGYRLMPGASVAYACANANTVYINGANVGDFVYYAGN